MGAVVDKTHQGELVAAQGVPGAGAATCAANPEEPTLWTCHPSNKPDAFRAVQGVPGAGAVPGLCCQAGAALRSVPGAPERAEGSRCGTCTGGRRYRG